MFRTLLTVLTLLPFAGCSALGLSLYPTGHYLTKETEQVLDQSCNTGQVPRELKRTVLPVHYLEPGDVLMIEPVKLESDLRFPADQHVMADGSIDLGGLGRVVVVGLTLEDAEQLVESRIVGKGHEATEVNVRLLESVQRFYVLGEVNSPGSYPLVGFETVLDGIVAAGGLTTDAAPCKVLLARPTSSCSCRVTLPVCYREITQMGDSATNYQLQPGDRIFVASRTFCEELMFWQATETCDRCRKCQQACRNPESVSAVTPVTPAGSRLARSNYQAVDHAPTTVEPLPASSVGSYETESREYRPGSSETQLSPEIKSSQIPVPKSLQPGLKSSPRANTRSQRDGQLEFSEPLQLPADF